MESKISLFTAIKEHILEMFFGKKYYFCLTWRPTVRVRPDDATQKPLPLVETSSCIFHSREAIKQYINECSDETMVFAEIHSFRSRRAIPDWNLYYNNKYMQNTGKTKLV